MILNEIIECIKEVKEDYWEDDGYGYATSECQRITTALDEAIERLEQTKWISVSERLPEEAGMYLCSYDDDDVGTSYFDIRINEFNMLHEQVTAWMYLPEPYNSEIPTGAEGGDKE